MSLVGGSTVIPDMDIQALITGDGIAETQGTAEGDLCPVPWVDGLITFF